MASSARGAVSLLIKISPHEAMGAPFYGYYVQVSTIKIEHRDPGPPRPHVFVSALSAKNVQKPHFPLCKEVGPQ